jgi:formylglycine-generating enzyme required for sulfatase activity
MPEGSADEEAAARLLSSSLLPSDEDVREQLLRRTGAVPLLLSQMPLLQRPLPLLLALRPLLLKQPHPRWSLLDEERSAVRSAELGRPWPTFVPRRVPAMEVRLWLDAGVAMAVWQPLAQDLQRLLASSQAFARVQLHCFGLEAPAATAPAAGEWGQSTAATTLHLVLSDTAGRHWWDGSMAQWLAGLARHQPVAIMHMLPIRYRGRTALRRGAPVTLNSNKRLGANNGYGAVPLASQDPRRRTAAAVVPPPEGLKLPVLSLDPRELAPWAALVMGDGLARSGGTVLPLADPGQPLAMPTEAAAPDASITAEDAANLWKVFCRQASPEAQRLMRHMAAAPLLTLPFLRMLLAAELPELVAPLPLAEVLVSGLVRRITGDNQLNPNLVQFELLPAVQELLEAQLAPHQQVRVIQAITDLLERRWNQQGHRDSFQALLTDPRTPLPEEAQGLAHFANVTAARLDRLPGQPFRQLAQELRSGSGLLPPPLWPAAMVFDEEPFEAAQLVDTPELEPIRTVAAQLVELELEASSFTTARLGADLTILRSAGSAWRFQEPLGPGALTLIQIPAGSFLMGSQEDEPQRHSAEGPQHEVTVQELFMGQTPITQAQWREVANWQEREAERWGRQLNPHPSHFGDQADSDQRSVEKVSWLDAMEFCHRLSQRTGRHYTLASEAQWEYACRAGSTTPFAFGATLSAELANYDATATYADGLKGEYREQTTPVGMFPANAWGLHDMHGNLWEWCLDHWHDSYEGAPSDGSAWLTPSASEEEPRLLRGGSWYGLPGSCRSAFRTHIQPDFAIGYVGFRVVCLPQGPSLNP